MKQDDTMKQLKSKSGETIIVDHQGSLGLLALGDIGLEIWRQSKRDSIVNAKKQSDQIKPENG